MKKYVVLGVGLSLILSAQDGCDPDNDGDGWTAQEGDCDDENPEVNPGVAEVCGDGIDNNCDGLGCLVGTIDLSQADAKLLGDQEDQQAGYAVASAGDLNGDGFGDLVIGAPAIGSTTTQGSVYTVYGSVLPGDMILSNAVGTLVGEAIGDGAGYSVAGVGDTDGDGYDDLLIGAPFDSSIGPEAGAAYLVLGPVIGTVSLGSSDAKFLGESAGDWAGSAVASAGDVNGDGYGDILIGAYGNDGGGGPGSGAVYLFYGPVSGQISLSDADAILLGSGANELAGYALAGAGDVDQDGYDDFLIGAPGGGRAGLAYLIYGPEAGVIDLGNFDAMFTGEAADDSAGMAVAGVGDVDGDGYPDVAIGAPEEDTGGGSAGAVYIPYAPYDGEIELRSADLKFTGENASDLAGFAVSSAGDMNGDGLMDLAIAATGEDTGGANAGAVYVLFGPADEDSDLANAKLTLVGESDEAYAGQSIASAGDVNGDGYDDLLIGAIGDETLASGAGAVYLVLGEGL